jgi:hypothetical protein
LVKIRLGWDYKSLGHFYQRWRQRILTNTLNANVSSSSDFTSGSGTREELIDQAIAADEFGYTRAGAIYDADRRDVTWDSVAFSMGSDEDATVPPRKQPVDSPVEGPAEESVEDTVEDPINEEELGPVHGPQPLKVQKPLAKELIYTRAEIREDVY